MRISLIVAMTHDRVIGRNGAMPWHLPADLQRFKRLTMGKPIIMGRKTFESLGRILPGRRHIVISRRQDYQAPGAEVVASLDTALAAAERGAADEVFVIGGGDIFRSALPRADRLYVTFIDAEIDGDTRFPAYDENDWREVARDEYAADEKNRYRLIFKKFQKTLINNKTHCPDATPEFHLVNRYLGWGDRGKDGHRGLWFVGMEEATGCDGWTPQQVRNEYANKPEWTPTLPPSQWGSEGKQVRDYACKIVLPLSRDALAKNMTLQKYRRDYLWQNNCQVCQTNVLPIGKNKVGALPTHFKDLFGYGPRDWKTYIECVRHTRILRLYDLWKEYRPQAVVCFGKGYWPYHKEIFGLGKPTEVLEGGDIEVYEREQAILTPFFRGGNHAMSDYKAERVSKKLSSWRVSIR